MTLPRKELFIIGGGGHSRVVIDSFLKSGRKIDGIVDQNTDHCYSGLSVGDIASQPHFILIV